MSEYKGFYEYFSKYPQDDPLRDILQFAKVKKILANKSERKLKAYIIFKEFVPQSTISVLVKNIKIVYGLKNVTVIDCYDGLSDAHQLTNVMGQITVEFPMLSGYCDGEFEYNENVYSIVVKFNGTEILSNMKIHSKVSEFLSEKFEQDIRVNFINKDIPRISYTEFKEKISIYEEKPKITVKEDIRPKVNPNTLLMGQKITIEPMEISDVRATGNIVCVKGSLYSVRKVSLKEERYMMLFSIEDKSGTVDAKFYINENNSAAADKLYDDMYVTVLGKADEDRTGGVVISVRSIVTCVKEERMDKSENKRSELHIHSTMSVADGLATPQEIVDRAEKWGLKSIAITDHGSIQSFPMALEAAKNKNLKIICGCEVYLAKDSEPAVYGNADINFKQRFVVFDIETTGLSIAADRITEIGAVVVENGERKEVFSTFVNPKVHIPERITELTGITDAMVADAPDEDEALQMFFDFAKEGVLVAHNANFDCGFMRAAAKRCGMEFPYTHIDTVPICRSIFPELKSVKLNIVAEHIGASKFKHHRAYDDANELAEIFIYLLDRLQHTNGISSIGLINNSLSGESVSLNRSSHATILVKNKEGLKNLYKIISDSYNTYYQKYPLVPKRLLSKYREGLLIGSSCCDGELFNMLLDERSEEDILDACRFYDYFEIQPLSNNMNMVDNGYMQESDQLRRIYSRLLQYGKEQGKPVIATGDAHFLEEEHEPIREIAMSVRGTRFDHSRGPIYIKTTEEMLADFEWVDNATAENLVINNPNGLVDMCDNICALPSSSIIIPDEDNIPLTSLIDIDTVNDIAIKDRLMSEIQYLSEINATKTLVFAKKIQDISKADGFPCSFAGEITTFLLAYLLGLTDYDPYEKGIEFDSNAKLINLNIVFVPEYRRRFLANINNIYGENHYFYASKIEYLSNDSIRGYIRRYEENNHTVVRENVSRRAYKLMERSKKQLRPINNSIYIVPKNMDCFDFSPVHKVFAEDGTSKIAAHYDTSAFEGRLLRLDFNDDIDRLVLGLLEYMVNIAAKDIPLNDSAVFEIFKPTESLMHIPDNFEGIIAAESYRDKLCKVGSFIEICACTSSYSEALIIYRLAWYKKYFPLQFYAAVLSAYIGRVNNSVFFETKEACRPAYEKDEADDIVRVMRILFEIMQRSITFGSYSIYDSPAFHFCVGVGGEINAPLILIENMSENEAGDIAFQREISEFQSVAQMTQRCNLDKKTVDAMRKIGMLDNMDEDAQISLFSLLN